MYQVEITFVINYDYDKLMSQNHPKTGVHNFCGSHINLCQIFKEIIYYTFGNDVEKTRYGVDCSTLRNILIDNFLIVLY